MIFNIFIFTLIGFALADHKVDDCGENEFWSECPPACYGDGCQQLVYIQKCNQTCDAEPRCVCKSGFFRNFEDKCVPKDECLDWDNEPYENFSQLRCARHPPKTLCGKIVKDTTNDCLDLCPALLINRLCIADQVLGCYCQPGFCQTERGCCVPRPRSSEEASKQTSSKETSTEASSNETSKQTSSKETSKEPSKESIE